MKGMELSKAYFDEYGRALLDKYPQYCQYMAAGLVGEGSECYGYDDDLSRDHDFGPAFCVWLPQKIYDEIGPSMQREYDGLPKTYKGFTRNETLEGQGRVGIFSIENFYERYTGCRPLPRIIRGGSGFLSASFQPQQTGKSSKIIWVTFHKRERLF